MENQPNIPQPGNVSQVDQNDRRPGWLTVYCILGFIVIGLLAMGLVMVSFNTLALSYLPGWYIPYLALAIPLLLAVFIGLWKMKKWAVILFTISSALGWIFTFSTLSRTGFNMGTILGIFVSIGILALLWKNFAKMS
jgi:hypothetical protein